MVMRNTKKFWIISEFIPERLHDNLPDAILPNLPFYPIPTYPMLFDLFVQLSDCSRH